MSAGRHRLDGGGAAIPVARLLPSKGAKHRVPSRRVVPLTLLGVAAWQALVSGSEFWMALVTGSAAMLADTVHNASDVVALLIATTAYLASSRFPRAEPLGLLGLAALMAFSAMLLLGDAWRRLTGDVTPPAELWLVAAVGGVTAWANWCAAWVQLTLGRRHGETLLVANGRHATSDMFTSIAVAAGAGAIWLGHAYTSLWFVATYADLVVAAGVAVIILRLAYTTAAPAWRALRAARPSRPTH